MRDLLTIERVCLFGHLGSMAFGLAGLLLVMPHPEFLAYVPAGQTMFQWSMAGGGVVYILLGTLTVALHAYRTLGWTALLGFLVPAVGLSLGSELLGTSTGFPFGHYSYLNGLGYKISGLVPFTIPLSWFYLGLSSYLLARNGLQRSGQDSNNAALKIIAAIFLGATLLTSWDFVLDPAMSQTAMPFWHWHQPGAFFGMPYQNFAGWLGTGAIFTAIATLIWQSRSQSCNLSREELNTPLIVYLGNFAFATIMSLAAGFWVPILLGILVGALPAVWCWSRALSASAMETSVAVAVNSSLGAAVTAPSASVSVVTK
ncbi:gamma-carotene 1'-hydroxylase CruF [Pseudanabaena sp. FACHB-2040]|uniref:gamma-carotene 1'-hydroxylase CruF n=1 Tax=Pseudanabaena sp. FACHB-2040 TaxID=2692859 RepID=UPI001689D6DC|nr:carotenoid biosynthesis protein [Pseudanabaena sp. FACHB-2040]MBD2260427.1 carotenoid biosynthesis protein [Pseudanabaena sp. FACHB-2040]